ncbi:Alpha-ketoglutarate-dependent dioxygenase alkB 6 [Actinomortierella ambigua]|uniref:Alpha-ketoglutarate-dependent dioxygenase alkB 6 n=1 Tax=Actinomortierella ambigua TaxID=1343610 RepID=A0A9P6PZT1_9FUNG|nr:Alpha-ketoglutarate-dependent dioxygenase alkB 6 [Actinomortierella ambigua]
MSMAINSLPPPLTKAPPSVFYLPDFISIQEEAELLAKVLGAPRPKWVQLKNRRCSAGGVVSPKGMVGEPVPSWLTTPLFDRLKQLNVFTANDGSPYAPNHVLINEYLPGQGIMPHLDGPAYFPTVATVSLGSHCILEFFKYNKDGDPSQGINEMGSSTKGGNKDTAVEDKEKHSSDRPRRQPDFSLLVQPRSLLVLKDQVYTGYMHGIREITEDDLTDACIVNMDQQPSGLPTCLERGTRISLTLRKVERVLSASKLLMARK